MQLAKLLAGAKKSAIRSRTKPRKVKKTTAKRTLSLNDRNVITWKDRLLKLGRNAPTPDKPRLELDRYLHCPDELATPAVVDFASEVLSWPMCGRTTSSGCTRRSAATTRRRGLTTTGRSSRTFSPTGASRVSPWPAIRS